MQVRGRKYELAGRRDGRSDVIVPSAVVAAHGVPAGENAWLMRVEQYLEKLWEVSWGPDWNRVMRPQFKVRYVTAKASGTVAGVKYESIKLDHGTMGSNGYRIHVNGKVVAYSGATEPTAPLDKLVQGADAAIVEATGPGDVFSHMSWEAATKLRKRHPDTRFFVNHVYSGTVTGAVKDLQVIEV